MKTFSLGGGDEPENYVTDDIMGKLEDVRK